MVHKIFFPKLSSEDNLMRDEATFEAIGKGTWKPFVGNQSWMGGYCRYGAAKLCAMMMMHELQHRLNQDAALSRICVLAVDPGYMSTGLQRSLPWLARYIIFQVFFPVVAWLMPNGSIRYPEMSASYVLRAAVERGPGLGELPKGLFFEGGKSAETSSESRDPRKRDLVWKESVKLAHLEDGETVLEGWR
ncbi:uncharacterized protein N0V89_006771 [Didymosphaeria variabile]|uniref:NAD(P)-binding protein n=1 Tax=Didymosphaeria variabile TaxID=1932322 RepID=A0A9W9C8V1_9PLEO|nr:uncharacterized protein N0V89_006771 [Didymosphaeria variabile]KAJ4351429.1 hypothetical protein N0V89_006771 [Didymosphaeria variabile]